jgi:HSP20 family protein
MTLVRWNSPKHFPAFSTLFENFFANEGLANYEQNGGFSTPSVNVKEAEDKFSIEVAAPGLNKENFKLHLENDVLTIAAEVKKEQESKEENFTRREFSYGSFKRSFTLPKSINTEQIVANYENGILNIQLPKKEEAKPKTAKEIEIN